MRFRHPLLRTAAWATRHLRSAAQRTPRLPQLCPTLGSEPGSGISPRRPRRPTAPASELEALADENPSRLGHAAASAALERAARLSDDPAVAADRLAAPIEDAALSGDVDGARDLADDIGQCRLIRKRAAEQDFLSLGRKPVTSCAGPWRRVCDHRVTTGQKVGGRVPPRWAAIRPTPLPTGGYRGSRALNTSMYL